MEIRIKLVVKWVVEGSYGKVSKGDFEFIVWRYLVMLEGFGGF